MSDQISPLLLVVDDSKTSRMLVSSIVASMRPDWRIAEAASGDESLKMIEADLPAFVSMDVNMPGMNGLEAAARIRLRHPEVRIALNTANVQESMRQEAARVGLFFVAKPITVKSITEMIDFFEK